jgi:dephospho-CoA kinase
LRVGLTGGVASGKSLVAGMLEGFGARVVDMDRVAREVVEPGQPALQRIVEAFGEDILDEDRRLDRRRMRERIFSDPPSRRTLEALLHPVIRARTLELIDAHERGGRAGLTGYVLVVVPLLVETGFGALVDRVLVVECLPEQQRERLMRRDGMTAEQAEAMLAAQAPPAVRRASADDVIDNSGPIAWTRAQAWRLHLRYMQQ